jgi:hypothetical protein
LTRCTVHIIIFKKEGMLVMSRFILSVALTFVVLLLFTQSTFAFTPNKEIVYWTSHLSNNDVAYCSPANIELIIKPGGIGESAARGHLNTARNQWIFISTTENDNKPTTITVYDGSRTELERIDPYLQYFSCMTSYDNMNFAGYNYYVGGGDREEKNVYRLTQVSVYIPKQPFLSFWNSGNYRGAYVHEIGHALGWYGHCRFNTAVMYSRSKIKNYYLTFEDRIQLIQIYN